MKCKYGCGKDATYQLKNGAWCCSKYSTQCPSIKKKNSEGAIKSWKDRECHLKGKPSWNKGLTKETDDRVKYCTEKIKEAIKEKGHCWSGRHHSDETKEKMRQYMLEKYKNGFEVRCGRALKYNYKSPIAGSIKVDGRWELAVAKYLDQKKVTWKRNTKRFPYINTKGKHSTYCPDFFVEEWNTFIEVKGYETDLDRCKWEQFKHPLQIWNADTLIELNIINKYGEVAEW